MAERRRAGGGAGGHGRDSAQVLRQRAEQQARMLAAEDPAALSVEEARRLLHELRVHQIELEMQNEELRRAQLALDASRARYFDLYDLAPVGYVTLGEQGSILEANLRASSMLGMPRDALVGQPLTRFIAPEDQDTYYRHRKKPFGTGEPQVCELRMKHQAGSPLWVRLETISAQAGGDDAPTTRATLSDITEERRLQLYLAQADRMASMGVLAAGVAHEINNPLTYVLYNIESLAEDLPLLAGAVARCLEALREKVGSGALAGIAGAGASLLEPRALADLVERARQAAEGSVRIRAVASGLGFFSRLELGGLALVDLNQAAEHAINMASNETRCRAVVVRDLGRVPQIMGSASKLAQLLLNLIVNAAHSIDEGAAADHRITVRTWAEAGRVFAEVTDTGCGIHPEDLDNIFEPFFTAKAPTRQAGLGLAIARRIASDFGGDIRVESTVGQGARFTVEFPSGRTAATSSPSPAVGTAGARGRILVVDDEEFVRTTIEAMLDQEHEVVTAGSGREAKEILQSDARFDLVLCDLMMSDVSGTALHAWLAEHQPRLARRLVFITGGAFTTQAHEFLARHSDIIRLEKPFDAERLLTLVRELVATAPS